MHVYHALAAHVSTPVCDDARFQENIGGVHSGEARGVGTAGGVEERLEDGFQTGRVGSGVAGVDMVVIGKGNLATKQKT